MCDPMEYTGLWTYNPVYDTGGSAEMNHHQESSEQLMFDRKRLNNRPLFANHQGNNGMTTVIDPRTFEPIQVDRPLGVKVTAAGNYIDVERYQTYVRITDFREIPRILINTPSFRFDGHGDTTGWQMTVNQRHFNHRPGRTVVRLLHGKHSQQEGVKIRMGSASNVLITTIDDVVSMFNGEFEIVHAHCLAMGPRMSCVRKLNAQVKNQESTIKDLREGLATLARDNANMMEDPINRETAVISPRLDGFTDEELLAEVHRRTMAAIGDYRGPKQRQPVTLDNIINLDDIKRIRFDEDRLRAVLEGEEAA